MDSQHMIEVYYRAIGIQYPHQIDLDDLADRLHVIVSRLDGLSVAFTTGSQRKVVLDIRESSVVQREQLAHEIAHHVLNRGNQLEMNVSFQNLQEEQTRRFALYMLAPRYMLDKLWSECPQYLEHEIGWLAETFRVTYECMARRLELYQERVMQDAWTRTQAR